MFLVINLCFDLTSLAQTENHITILKGEELNGKVKKLDEKQFSVSKELQDTLRLYDLTYDFSEVGLLQQRKGLGQLSIYSYYTNDQLKKVSVCDNNGEDCTENDYSYKNGKLIRHFSKHPESTDKRTVFNDYFVTKYTYDDDDRLTDKVRLRKPTDSDIEIQSEHIRFKYDSIGNKVIEEKLNQSGAVVKRVEHKFTDTLLQESHTWMEFEGEDLYTKDIYQYFDNGRLASIQHMIYQYNSETQIATINETFFDYEFDKNGRLTGETKRSVYHYGEKNEIVKETTYQQFDDYNNWRVKKVVDDGDKKFTVRQIEYFDHKQE